MPNPADILSLQDDEDPSDALRMMVDQGQGNNLAGAPQPPGQGGMPGPPPPGPPSPNVPGPLAALPKMVPRGKPHIRLKSKKPKPKIKLKASAYGGSI